MQSNDDVKTQVLAGTDIVNLIGQSVALKRRGRKFLGLCPFHQEKSPSFNVDSTKQFFYCFGCKAHGNAIDFVIKRDRVEFIDALKLLAAQAGIEMPKFGMSNEKQSERQVLLEAHSAACVFFEKLLADAEVGRTARAYLEKRGFTRETIKAFQIGLSRDAWDGLVQSPLMKKYPVGLLHQAGLVKSKEDESGRIERYYDTFRDRLMFPIKDESGRIIAFGGRVLPAVPGAPPKPESAKYLNSPETPLFSKSRSIFGLSQAKEKIVSTRVAVVVEGYTDVVMAHQYGVTNVVSILGTAMTDQHVSLLRRFADKIVLLFDSDSAGATAADRALELVVQSEVQLGIATLPDGLDPDEFVMKFGPDGFNDLVKNAPDAIDFKSSMLAPKLIDNGGTVATQTEAFDEIVRLFGSFRTTTEQQKAKLQSMLKMFSKRSGIEEKVLVGAIRESHKKRAFRIEGPAGRSDELKNGIRPAFQETGEERAQRWVLAILLAHPNRWQVVQQHLGPDGFTDETCRKLAQVYWDHQRDEGEPVFNEFLGILTDESVAQLAVELIDEGDQFENIEQILSDSIQRLTRVRINQESLRKHTSVVERIAGKESESEEAVRDAFKKLIENAMRNDIQGRA